MNSFRRFSVRLLSTVLAVLLTVSAVPVAGAVSVRPGLYRIYGATRYETAFAAADALQEQLGAERFDTVIVASGTNFPDALSASYLACRKAAPVLLTNGSNTAELTAWLQEHLAPQGTVYLLGGEKAVSAKNEADLAAAGDYRTVRLGGADRYETNLLILREAGVSGQTVLVCTGTEYADSLCAAATGLPILLVSGKGLTDEQYEILRSASSACIIGGEKAVSVETEALLSQVVTTMRIGGTTRYETSAHVAEHFLPEAEAAVLTYGRNFPDALCAGVLANAMEAPILLADNDKIDAAADYVQEKTVTDGIVLGGPGLIGDDAVRKVFGAEQQTEIPVWTPQTDELGQVKEENVDTVLDYTDRLYTENIRADYSVGGFTWDKADRNSNWIYFTGLMHDAFLTIDFDRYYGEVKKYYDQHIQDSGKISGYIVGELDAALLGVNIVQLLNSGVLTDDEETKYAAALNYIYHQLENQTIYPEAGNLWLHSQKADGTPRAAWVKWNICLDGVYMSQLFLVRLTEAIDRGNVVITGKDGAEVTSEALWADIYSRLSFVMEHMTNPDNGLLYHGYCVETGETNKASWSRGIGWYTMVLVEAAEKIPDDSKKATLTEYFTQIMTAVLAQQDPDTSLWYNVTDGREEYAYRKTTESGETVIYNMPESSGSAMFAYCLLRGYHKGLLKDETFRTAGLRAFNALVETKLTEEGLTDIYHSSSVTSDKNLYQKNGYTTNDGKGVGPLILAANYAY